MELRENSNYFCQVQGQIAIGERLWCDFVVYTPKGISIEQITFDPEYWEKRTDEVDRVLQKLFCSGNSLSFTFSRTTYERFEKGIVGSLLYC